MGETTIETTLETTIETRTADAVLEGHVIHVRVHPGAEVTVEDAQEHLEAGWRLAAGLDYTMLLIDMGQIQSVSREARMHYRQGDRHKPPDRPENRAVAIVVASFVGRAIANFFLGLNRPPIPVKLFDSAEAAMAWLRGFEG